jgi:protein-export membrane protein SecD
VLHFARWKTVAILLTVAIAALFAMPNVLSPSQKALVAPFGMRPMTLGLDLQGGVNVLLEVDKKDMTTQLQKQLASDVRAALRDAKIAYGGIQRIGTGVSVKVTKPEQLENARTVLRNLVQPQQGNLLTGGTAVNLYNLAEEGDSFTFAVNENGLVTKISSAIAQSIQIFTSRINGLGTTEASIQQYGGDKILIQYPGLDDTSKLLRLLQGTGKLYFQLVCEDQPTAANQNPPPDCDAFPSKEDVDAATARKKAAGDTSPLSENELGALPQLWVQTGTRAIVDGADLNDAQPSFDQSNRPVVSFRFNQKGALRFGKLTADNVNKPFAIVLDGVVQSAPVINEPILGGSGQISGNFSVEETGDLSIVLRSGALPAKFVVTQETLVGPSLGAESVRAGFLACLVGLVGVMLFMFLPYGLFGLFANIALLANMLMLIAIMSFFGFTLTLPGIAGILLTLGMAVDSNVLIYERIREEWKNGRSALSSIEVGFKSALGTVLDANITTLIAAVALFGVSSPGSPVQGFAVTLALGIFTTMFTAFTLTRLVVALWVQRSRPKEINL